MEPRFVRREKESAVPAVQHAGTQSRRSSLLPDVRLDAIVGWCAVGFAVVATLGWLIPLILRGVGTP